MTNMKLYIMIKINVKLIYSYSIYPFILHTEVMSTVWLSISKVETFLSFYLYGWEESRQGTAA